MSISTKKREQKEGIDLYVGWDEMKVIAINPDREKLNEILGTEKTDEIEYLSEDDGGNAKIRLTFWLESVKHGWKQSVSFWIAEKERENKDGGNYQWVNQSGITTWSDEEENLPTWFKHFTKDKKPVGDQFYRKAYDGEEQFINFLSSWLNVDRREDTGVLPDMKKLFRGNIKELNSLINSDVAGTVIISLGVKTKDVELKDEDGNLTGETEPRDFQSVFNKAFLPGKYAKNLRIGGGNDYIRKQIEYFKKAHEGDYGFKDYWVFQEAKVYNPEENIVHSEKEIKDDDVSY